MAILSFLPWRRYNRQMEYIYRSLSSFRKLRVRRLDPPQGLVHRHRLRHHVRFHVRSLYKSFRRPSHLGVPLAQDRLPSVPSLHGGAFLQSSANGWLDEKIFGGVMCLAGSAIILVSRLLYT